MWTPKSQDEPDDCRLLETLPTVNSHFAWRQAFAGPSSRTDYSLDWWKYSVIDALVAGNGRAEVN